MEPKCNLCGQHTLKEQNGVVICTRCDAPSRTVPKKAQNGK
jgi:uncharacterized membrane protein